MRALPRAIRRAFGLGLYAVQLGEPPPDAKPLRGFGGAVVLELIGDRRGSPFRSVYTVRFKDRFMCCTYPRSNRRVGLRRRKERSS
jgi:phage-related protein